MFWSTKNPRVRVRYICRIKEVLPKEKFNNSDFLCNTTTVHSVETQQLKEEPCKISVENPLQISNGELEQTQGSTNVDQSGKDLYSLEGSDLSNMIVDDVIKVLHRVIKKVIRTQKRYWKKMKNKLAHCVEIKGTENDKGIFLDNCKIFESEVCLNNLVSNQESLYLEKEFQGNSSQIKSSDTRSVKETNEQNVVNMHKKNILHDNFKSLSDISNHCEKNSCSEIFRKYLQRTEWKKLKKKLKSGNSQHSEDAEKLLHLISDKDISKEISDLVLRRYKDIGKLPSKIVSLLDSVLPPCSVSETVLPVFVEGNENSGINESSGYSSNDDTHLRQPIFSHTGSSKVKNTAIGGVIQNSNKNKRLSEIKLNGRKDFSHTIGCSSVRCNRMTSDVNLSNINLLDNNACNIKNLNGISQNISPFKCTKCKRVYRTDESFKKHTEECNFIVDSSSTEESSDSSSEGSDESYDSSSDENISKDLSLYPLWKPSQFNNNSSKDKKDSTSKSSSHCSQNVTINMNKHDFESQNKLSSYCSSKRPTELICSSNITEKCLNQGDANSVKCGVRENRNLSCPYNNSQYSNNTVRPLAEQSQKMNTPCQQALNSAAVLQCRPPMPSARTAPNTSVNVDNVSLNAGSISNNYNLTFNNTVCSNVTAGIGQLPCNTLIIPPAPEPIPPQNPIIQLPPNNFYNPTIDLSYNTQLSYVGSITVTNNENMSLAVNMADQVIPIFPQTNLNFGQPTLIPNPIQMQQPSGIQLSTLNVQQISVQGAFSTNSLNPFIFPQQAVNIPQNQMVFIEDPISHQLSSSSPSQNFVIQVQPENTFTTFVPQQQYISPVAFNSSVQNNQNLLNNVIPEQSKNLASQEEKTLKHENSMPILKPQEIKNNNNMNQRISNNKRLTKPPVISPEPVYSPKFVKSSSTPSSSSCTTTPSVSSRSTPVPECIQGSQSNVQSVAISSDSNIMDILKKAAEQVLSFSEMAKRKAQSRDQSADSGAPEKKTRFAHTRKVAARRAEKLKLKKNSANFNAAPQAPVNKPKTLHLNIATLKSIHVPIPVVPVSSSENCISNSLPPAGTQ